MVHDLARMSAAERRRIIDDFVNRAFDGVAADAPGARIATGMRQVPTELPDAPTGAQVDAWAELAELVENPSFQQRVRSMALTRTTATAPGPLDPTAVREHAGQAVAAGIPPESLEGSAILDRIVSPTLTDDARVTLVGQLETFTDRSVERYWELLGVINGWPSFPSTVPAFEWVIAALHASKA